MSVLGNRIISAASFSDRTVRVRMVEAAFTDAQIRSGNTVPQVIVNPPFGAIILPQSAFGILVAGSAAFSGAVSVGFTLGTVALAAVLGMGDGTASSIITADPTAFGTDMTDAENQPLAVKTGADRTAGTGASLRVFVTYLEVYVADLIPVIA